MSDMIDQKRATPAVSVIMPAYNEARFIEAAIRSVQQQSFTDWELLVLDDGSSDDTCAIVQRLAAEDSRIYLHENAQNMGVAKTRNHGFDICRGRYVALLDGDDLWLPQKLELQLKLAEETGADVIYCSYSMVDEQDNKKFRDFLVPEQTNFYDCLTKTVISCSTALLSYSIIEKYRFDTSYYHEDLALWLRILKDGYEARGVPQVLAKYRVMGGTRAANKLKSAARRWPIYHGMLGFSAVKSLLLIAQYGLLGLKKYQR